MFTIIFEYTGALILLATLVTGCYFILRTKIELKRISAFTVLGLFVGFALLLAGRITSIKIPVLGEITATAKQVRTDASEVRDLRIEIEKQKNAIDLIVRDANAAKQELDRLDQTTQTAQDKLNYLQEVVSNAEKSLSLIQNITELSILLERAANDDRQAFDQLVQISTSQSQFKQIANRAIVEIAYEINPAVQLRIDPKVPWESLKISPKEAPLEEWLAVYSQIHPLFRPKFLSEFWQQDRFEKKDKIDFLCKIIKTDNSLRTVHRACMLVNKEAKIDKNILAKELYLEWWEKNKKIY